MADASQCRHKRGVQRLPQLAVLLVLLVLPGLVAAFQTPRMKRFSPAEGLPSRQVVQVVQDGRGFVWAATPDGLARLDGQGLKVWQHAPGQPGSLPGNDVETLAVDSRNRILMGINGKGLARLHADGIGVDTFPRVNETCGAQIWTLATQGETVWIGGNGKGICRLHPDGKIDRIGVGDAPGQLRDGSIMAMRLDGAGRMWIATLDGLWRWHDGQLQEVAATQFAGQPIARLRLDSAGVAWVGDRRGLWRIGGDDQARAVEGPAGRPLPWPDVLHDSRGSLWIGSSRGLFLRQDGATQLLSSDAGSGFLTERSGVLDMLEDHEGGIWFATQGQGLAYLPPYWQRFWTRYEVDGVALESVELNAVAVDGDGFLVAGDTMVLRLDGKGHLQALRGWESFDDGGVMSLLKVGPDEYWLGRVGRITRIHGDGRRIGEITLDHRQVRNRVDLMAGAADGSIWLAVINMGLEQRAADGRLLRTLRAGGPEGLPEDFIHQIRPAPDGSLWLATGGGVYRWDGQRVRPVVGIEPGEAYDLVFAWRQLVWVATHGRLTRYLWDEGRAVVQEVVGPEQGMPPVEVGGMHIGDGGQLWATTARGLLRWDGSGRVRSFGHHDGLVDVEFNDRPPVRNGNRMLAISAMGLTVFDLDQQLPPLPSSQLVIDTVSVRRKGGPAPERLLPGSEVVLNEGDYDLEVQARMLSFANPAAHAYRYRISGLGRQWRPAGSDGRILLSSLPAGRHRIIVQAHNGDGVWQTAEAIAVRVLPVWWQRPWALCLWGGMLIGAALLVAWALRQRRRRRERWRMTEHRREVAEQSSREKSRFLATLGHEVRTPMTGVLGMSELLLGTPLDDHQRTCAGSIHAAGSHLLRLLDDTLDMAALESGQAVPVEMPFALQLLLDDVQAAVLPRLRERGLAYGVSVDLPGPVWIRGDRPRLRQMLVNLVSHLARNPAFPSIGLEVVLSPLGDGVEWVVHNGAPPAARQWEGTGERDAAQWTRGGLGLAIARAMAEAMGGNVEAAGQSGIGHCLRARLPLAWGLGEDVASTVAGRANAAERELHILLVEDDATVARVICGLLRGRGHHVEHACHALQALALATTERFDVGLLDLDLPGIDGLALARQIRAMGLGMPLLAVTARADADTEQAVREAGMDACVRKPVTGILLAEAMVKALAETRAAPDAQAMEHQA